MPQRFRIITATVAGMLLATAASAQIAPDDRNVRGGGNWVFGTCTGIVNGDITGDGYGDALAVQAVNTGFGDNLSELNAAYAMIQGDRLYLALTGNLEGNFNKLEIFLDTKPGGENVFSGVPGNDNTDVMIGLTFDSGFEADYHIIARRGFFEIDKFDLDIAELGTPNFSSYLDVFGGVQIGCGETGTGAGNASPIEVAYNDSNTAGVIGDAGGSAADPTAALAVRTGFEMSVALSDIGDPSGSFKIQAWVNGGSHDFASNQFLGALTPPQINLGGDGLGNWNGLLEFDLNGFPGEQWFTFGCDAPCDMNCDGMVDANDIEFFIDILFNGAIPCDVCTGDTNGDGVVDAGDIEGFINCLFP